MIIPNLVTDDNYHENKTTAVKSLLDSLHLQAYNYTDQSVQLWRDHNGKGKQKGLIMKTAKQLFAERVRRHRHGEIASNAGVPKSHLLPL